MRTQTMPALNTMLPAEVQAGIRAVNKLTSAGNQNPSIVTTSDELFLLSEIEIFGSTTYSFAGEGLQYDYYKAGNSKVKNRAGSADFWLERSSFSQNTSDFCDVHRTGSAFWHGAYNRLCVAFSFCL